MARTGNARMPSSPHPANQGGATSAHVQTPIKDGTPQDTSTTPMGMSANQCASIVAPGTGTSGDGTTSRTPGDIC
jgi:hypothetical protein